MGKKTLKKLKDIEIKEMQFKNVFQNHSISSKQNLIASKKILEVPLIDYIDYKWLSKKIREPEDFKLKFKTNNIEKRFVPFMRHIFCKYKAPKFFDNVIKGYLSEKVKCQENIKYKSNTLKYDEHINWFLCIGSGGSIYKEYFKDYLTKKETHIFSNCVHDDLSVKQVITYSIAFAESEDVGISKKLALSNFSLKDNMSEFWKNCIKFFSNNENMPETINKINDIIDYLQHEKQLNIDFSIFGSGFTLNSLSKRMTDWHHELRRAKEFGSYSWDGVDIEDFIFVKNDGKESQELFKIEQLKTSKDLLRDGKEQHHCVFSYKRKCIEGIVSIWSLSINGKKKVTIELKDNNIIQSRGFANRATKPNEDFIILKWCSVNNINYNKIY